MSMSSNKIKIRVRPPLQFNHDVPHMQLSHNEKNKVVTRLIVVLHAEDMDHTPPVSAHKDAILQRFFLEYLRG